MAPSDFSSAQMISVLASFRSQLESSLLCLDQSLLLIVLLAITSALFLRSWFSARKLPPSPPSWPLIGHVHLLGTHAHQSMAALSAKYAPGGIMYLKFGLKRGIIVSTPEMAKEIFRKHDLAFSHRPQLPVIDILVPIKAGVALQSNNESWRTLRKIFVQEVLSPKRMQLAERLRADEMDYMVNSIFKDVTRDPKTPIQVNKKLWMFTLNFTSRLVMSKRYFSADSEEQSQEAEEFDRVMLEFFAVLGSIFPADSFPFLKPFDIGGLQKRTKALLSQIQGILTKILNERREQRKRDCAAHVDVDMVDVLLTKQEKGVITKDNIVGAVWDAFAGGTDTQINTVEWAMAHILADSKIAETLREELDREVGVERRVAESDLPRLKYLNAIMKETFRLHAPSPLLLPHETFEECTVAGYYVPANTRLFVNVWAMGRDPRVWDNPEEFRPERFLQEDLQAVDVQGQDYSLIPFGAGRRICPGIAVGLIVVQFGIASLVQAFHWSLPDGMKAEDMDWSEGVGLTAPMSTPLRALAEPRLATHLYAI